MCSPARTIIIVSLAFVLFGCEGDDTTTNPTPTGELGRVTVDGTTIVLRSETPLRVGYSAITIESERASAAKPLSISVRPIMPRHNHGCPVTPPLIGPMYGDIYRCGLIFGMPGTWKLRTTVRYSEIDSVIADFTVNVDSSDLVRNIRIDNERGYVITMIPPATWQTGSNNVHFYVYETSDVQSYRAVSDCEMEITPWMTTMEHGSAGNVNPLLIRDGLYSGNVNITMAGAWTLTNVISKPYGILTKLTFSIVVP